MNEPQQPTGLPEAESIHECEHCKKAVRFGDTALSVDLGIICYDCNEKELDARQREHDQKNAMRRLGSFQVDERILVIYPEEFQKIMAECLVTRCEFRYDTRAFHYTAISKHFAEVPQGAMPPDYHVQMETIRTGTDERPQSETKFRGFVPMSKP